MQQVPTNDPEEREPERSDELYISSKARVRASYFVQNAI